MFTQKTIAVDGVTADQCQPFLGGVPNGTHPPICLIETDEGMKAMSARALHKSLSLNERFSKWTERMFEYGFVDGIDYTPHKTEHPQNGQQYLDYILTLACGKEIAMLQRTEQGKRIRLYLLECERQIERIATGQVMVASRPCDCSLQLAKLERKIDAMKRDHVKALKQIRINRQYRLNERAVAIQRSEMAVKREETLKAIIAYHKQDRYGSLASAWYKLWDIVKEQYALDMSAYTRYQGEHLVDVAVRAGKINIVHEAATLNFAKYL